jgi:tRNA (adenine57-N1/adenine58-N1)-methyltransferase
MVNKKVVKNEIVILVDSSYKRYFIDTNSKIDKIKGIGVFDPKILIDLNYGERIQIGNKQFWIFRPSLMDKILGLKRKAQIILPKDAAYIIFYCSIESGHRVLEAGIGSGSLTIALANAVAPNGNVISYDTRQDFIKHALKNLRISSVKKYIEIKHKDITLGIEEKNLDAIILDIPNPWEAIEYAWGALKSGGYLCCYSPLISQVEKTVLTIEKQNFIEIKTIENIQREMIVTSRGTRPSFNMLGHSGYLTFARKVL